MVLLGIVDSGGQDGSVLELGLAGDVLLEDLLYLIVVPGGEVLEVFYLAGSGLTGLECSRRRGTSPNDGGLDRGGRWCIHKKGVFKKRIVGWIQVDRMMVMGCEKSVDIIFDINGYAGYLRMRSRRSSATPFATMAWDEEEGAEVL